jgi:hypothetical protein
MTTAENPRAVPGDNAPPDPLLTEASERVDAANRWLKERSDWTAWDADLADRANFFLSQIGATWKALDDRRLEEGREFKKKQDTVYKDPLSLLDLAKEKLAPLRRKWLQREEARLEEQRAKAAAEAEAARKAAAEAERKAAEAATKKGGDPLRAELEAQKAKDAAAEAEQKAESVPDRAQIKGAYSPRAKGLQDHWSATITDISLAFKHYNAKNNPNRSILAAAIQEAPQGIANAEAKRVKDENAGPPGITFVKERK